MFEIWALPYRESSERGFPAGSRKEVARMGKWTSKDERMYEHIKEGEQERGVSTKRSKEIAARTVNKNRREEGKTRNKTTQGTGNPRTSLEERSRQELYNQAKQKKIEGRSQMSKRELVSALRGR
jgi:hypothetical protein